MAYEERRVVADPAETVETAPAVESRRVVEPSTVVESRPSNRYVQTDDPVGNVFAATQLIQTIVWSVVVLVLLVVALLALHSYAHLF
jgi:hypothetical protein